MSKQFGDSACILRGMLFVSFQHVPCAKHWNSPAHWPLNSPRLWMRVLRNLISISCQRVSLGLRSGSLWLLIQRAYTMFSLPGCHYMTQMSCCTIILVENSLQPSLSTDGTTQRDKRWVYLSVLRLPSTRAKMPVCWEIIEPHFPVTF